MGGSRGEPLHSPDRRRAAAAGRLAADRFAACARLRDRRRDERHDRSPRWPGLDLRQPQAGAELVIRRGQELKLVYPQADAAPEAFADLDFERFSLQPMDGPDVIENTARAVEYCLRHPQWRLSLQTHKTLGIR